MLREFLKLSQTLEMYCIDYFTNRIHFNNGGEIIKKSFIPWQLNLLDRRISLEKNIRLFDPLWPIDIFSFSSIAHAVLPTLQETNSELYLSNIANSFSLNLKCLKVYSLTIRIFEMIPTISNFEGPLKLWQLDTLYSYKSRTYYKKDFVISFLWFEY